MVGISIVLIVSGYQFYFWPQRKPLRTCNVGKVSSIDSRIPFQPQWVWIYSALYYPFMISPVIWISSAAEFMWICASYVLLLFIHVAISMMYPIKTPTNWRDYNPNTYSKRFLKFIQSIDKGGNCFPSMHVAVATLTALHMTFGLIETFNWIVILSWSSVVAISLSSVLTKQHFTRDIVAAFPLSCALYYFYSKYVDIEMFSIF